MTASTLRSFVISDLEHWAGKCEQTNKVWLVMDKLIEKLSSYNIFNYLLPGVLFATLGSRLTMYHLFFDNVLIGFFVYYFYGLIISRIGSLLLEPFLKWSCVVKFCPYHEFVKASKVDKKIELLSETNNMYRTMSSLFVCLFLLKFYEYFEIVYPSISTISTPIIMLSLMILFALSYRKQTQYIVSRIQETKKYWS